MIRGNISVKISGKIISVYQWIISVLISGKYQCVLVEKLSVRISGKIISVYQWKKYQCFNQWKHLSVKISGK